MNFRKPFHSLLVPMLSLSLLTSLSVFSAEAASKQQETKNAVTAPATPEVTLDYSKISESFGHLIGKNLESLGFEFDMNKIIKGIQDSIAGKEPPMNEAECVQAITLDQEKKFKKLSEDNLKKAEEFLNLNSKKDGVISLEENKLQYKVEKQGTGETVQPHFTPLIRYTGMFLDGKVFGASREDEMISLDETIPGFSKGILGMKEGEKRMLFIHPDFAYGTNGYLPPNSLLQFEIEVVKANSPQEPESLSSVLTDPEEDAEIANTIDSAEDTKG